MKKVIKLTEKDLTRIVKRIIKEEETKPGFVDKRIKILIDAIENDKLDILNNIKGDPEMVEDVMDILMNNRPDLIEKLQNFITTLQEGRVTKVIKNSLLALLLTSILASCGTGRACKPKRGHGSLQHHSWGQRF